MGKEGGRDGGLEGRQLVVSEKQWQGGQLLRGV